MKITNTNSNIIPSVKNSIPLKSTKTLESPSFSERLDVAVKNVNERQIIGDESTEKVLSGELGIHEAMLNLQEADVTLKLFAQVRNKLLDAYKEVNRMQF